MEEPIFVGLSLHDCYRLAEACGIVARKLQEGELEPNDKKVETAVELIAFHHNMQKMLKERANAKLEAMKGNQRTKNG